MERGIINMIWNFSEIDFKKIINNKNFFLPKRWDGKDFSKTIEDLFCDYINDLDYYHQESENKLKVDIDLIEDICNHLIKSIKNYHNGYPTNAFDCIDHVMRRIIRHPLAVYQKSGYIPELKKDNLYLYRIRDVGDNKTYSRQDMFHVPANLREMISTYRYSIAGYPSLYLTTSVDLGLEEIAKPNNNAIVSRYKLIRNQSELNIQVLELGIKPQDFLDENKIKNEMNYRNVRDLSNANLNNSNIKEKYLEWYPIIAACSFIRINKNNPFSSEYIIPQLIMQWVRKQLDPGELIGIRYFSCASMSASEKGYNYVFPVNNTSYKENYCSVLREAFMLTEPVFLKDYSNIEKCIYEINKETNLKKI